MRAESGLERGRRIREMARAWRQDGAELLAQLVRIPSFSGREEQVCRRIAEACREAGLEQVRFDGLGSVVARLGEGGRTLAFDAHVDTVEAGDESQWRHPPFAGRIADGRVYGRGAADQKGGAAALLTAARILKSLGYRGGPALLFTFTVMEEDCDGMCWRYLIEEERLVPDFFVSTEPTGCHLYRGQRGRMEIACAFRGVSAHGAMPERGVSAAYQAARAALAVERLNAELPPDEDGFLGKGTVVVSRLEARGPSQCAVPDRGLLYLDRRLTWGETAEGALEQVRRAIGADLRSAELPRYDRKGWRGAGYGQELYFPAWKTPADHPLVRAGAAAYRTLYGKEPGVGRWTFSTNAVAVCGRHGIPAIGFGPGEEAQAHAPDEEVRIDELETASAFYAQLPYCLEEK